MTKKSKKTKKPDTEKNVSAEKKTRRGYGDGSIYKMPDGTWRAVVEFGLKPDGRRDRRYARGKTKTVVQQKLRALRIEQAGGEPVTPRNRRLKELTLSQWLDQWLESVVDELEPNTVGRYRGVVRNQLKPTLGKMFLRDIKPTHVRTALAEVRRLPKLDTSGRKLTAERLSESSVRQTYAVLRRALRAAMEDELVSSNAAASVRAPKVDPDKQLGVKAFDEHDARRLLIAASETTMPARWYLAVVAGARQSECLGLAWDAIDLEKGQLKLVRQLKRRRWQHGCTADDPCEARRDGCPTGKPCPGGPTCPHAWHRARNKPCPVKSAHPNCHDRLHCIYSARRCDRREGGGFFISPTKTKLHRTMMLPEFLLEALRTQKARQAFEKAKAGADWESRPEFKDLVFTGPRGRPLDHKADRDNWLTLLATAGLDETRLHNARHTAATILTDLGYDTAVIQTMLGHSTAAMSRRYQQTSAATTAAAAEGLNKLYGDAV